MKAILNDEGMKVWEKIFPNGIIPIKSPIVNNAKVAETNEPIRVYMVDWATLTDTQRENILQRFSERTGWSMDAVEEEILKVGLPLQEKYVSTVAIPMRFFI